MASKLISVKKNIQLLIKTIQYGIGTFSIWINKHHNLFDLILVIVSLIAGAAYQEFITPLYHAEMTNAKLADMLKKPDIVLFNQKKGELK